VDGEPLRGDRPVDDRTVPHRVGVRVHQPGDQSLAEAEAGLHGGDLPVGRHGVGREQDAGHLREDHLLHDHGHVDGAVVDAVPLAVGHGPLGEERGPAPADVLEDRGRPDDVQVGVLLTGEGGRRQVLRRRAGSDGEGGPLTERGESAGDRHRHIVGEGGSLDGPADLPADRSDRLPVVRGQARQLVEPVVDGRRLGHDPPEGVRRDAEAGRHVDAVDPGQRPEMRALAADDRDLALVDLGETPHVPLGHRDTSAVAFADAISDSTSPRPRPVAHNMRTSCPVSSSVPGSGRRFCGITRVLRQDPRCDIR
jgi:hypothetical protein